MFAHMLLAVVVAVFGAMPAGYEIDFSNLPAPKMVKGVGYVLVLSFPGEPDTRIDYFYAGKYGPADHANGFAECLEDSPRWKWKRDDMRITVYGYDQVRIANFTVEGKGLKPEVRRVPDLRPQKK